jgi:hypothetical protein
MEWVTPDVLPPPNTNSGGIFNIEVTHVDIGMHRRREGVGRRRGAKARGLGQEMGPRVYWGYL